MRRKFLIVAFPFLVPLAALAYWLLAPPSEQERARELRRAAAVAEWKQLQPGVEAGDPAALTRAGIHLVDGLSGVRDPSRGALYFSRAAEQGNAAAAYRLGRLYEQGAGVRVDYGRAAEWYRLAAGLGNDVDGQFALAELYFKGRGVFHDYHEAIFWYVRAARGGHPAAQALLGAMFETGWLLERDYAEAYKWYSLAAERRTDAMSYRRDLDPLTALAALEPRMSRLQRMRGEQKLRAFASAPIAAAAVQP